MDSSENSVRSKVAFQLYNPDGKILLSKTLDRPYVEMVVEKDGKGVSYLIKGVDRSEGAQAHAEAVRKLAGG